MELDLNESRWKALYRAGAVCAFLAFIVMVTEIFLTSLPDGSVETAGVLTIDSWFDLLQRNWFMGMRNLGLINIMATTLMIPPFLSLCALHSKDNAAWASLSLIFFITGYAIFMADNVAFPMLALSKKYAAADSESQRMLFAAAGEALLVKGSSHTPGTFPGFFLSELASISICFVMIKGKVFNKITGIIGVIAFLFLFIFEVCSSFITHLSDTAMIFAIIGGVSAIAWYILLGLKLAKVSK